MVALSSFLLHIKSPSAAGRQPYLQYTRSVQDLRSESIRHTGLLIFHSSQ